MQGVFMFFLIVHALAEFIRKKCCICFKATYLCMLSMSKSYFYVHGELCKLLLKSCTCTW